MSDTISVQVLDGGDTIHAGVVEYVDKAKAVSDAVAQAEAYTDMRLEALTVATLPAVATVDALYTVGDSLTESDQDGETGDAVWGQGAATDLGIPWTQGGIGGQTSTEIAIRQGGFQPQVTVTANQIPATGGVSATVAQTTSLKAASFSFPGVLYADQGDGTTVAVPGRMSHDAAGVWTFTRTDDGDVIACAAGSVFVGSEGVGHEGDIQTIWAGRNNLSTADTSLAVAIRDVDLMVRHLRVGNSRYLIFPPVTSTGETTGTANHDAVTAATAVLAQRHADHFFDLRGWLISYGLQLAGMTPTPTDLGDIGGDTIPTSLRALTGDGLHLSAAGYTLVRHKVEQLIAERGYLPGLIPATTPDVPAQPTVGTVTTSTIPLTLASVTGAVAYAVQFRRTGTTVWVTGRVNTTGTAVTLTGLLPGTSYDIQVRALNYAGVSDWSDTLEASSADTPPTVLTSDGFTGTDGDNVTGRAADLALGGSAATWGASGSIAIIGGKIQNTNAAARFATITAPTPSADGRVSWLVDTLDTGSSLILLARWTDNSNYYGTQISPTGAANIIKKVGGTQTTLLAAITGAVNPGDRVGLSVVGTTITLYVNGVEIGQVTDSALSTGTSFGAQLPPTAGGARLDDFILYDK
jgi:lysophospholipase L1-like esterase